MPLRYLFLLMQKLGEQLVKDECSSSEPMYKFCHVCKRRINFCYCSNCPYCRYTQCNYKRSGLCVATRDANVAVNNPGDVLARS